MFAKFIVLRGKNYPGYFEKKIILQKKFKFFSI